MSDGDSDSGGSRRPRRKRLGSSSPLASFHPPKSYLEDTESIPAVPNPTDLNAINFISSPLKVWQVISSFNSVKRKLVKSMGFGGILSLPRISTENKAFTYWLLSHVKWYTTTLSVGEKISLILNPGHIGKITGLSTVGEVISEKSIQTLDDKSSFIERNLSFIPSENGILEGAEMFVQRDYPGPMSNEDKDNFKVAFAIFVIGCFLAPSTEHPDGNTNFWGALENPDSIGSYNWSLYVYANLKKAARLVNWVTPQKMPLTSVMGCSLILQIFYLDNVDFGALNLQHEILPRWTNFSDQHINEMIAADRIIPLVGSSIFEYGRTQATREGSTCYIFSNDEMLQLTCYEGTDCPPTYPLRQRRSSREKSTTPEQSDEDTFQRGHSVAALPISMTTAPNFEKEVLDFNDYIGNKYQGKVEAELLEEIKSHNSRCLSHLSNSYLSFAHAIVNENAQLASRFLDQRFSPHPNLANVPYNSTFQPRRRRNNDRPSGTDSSTDAEDNSLQRKIHRNMIDVATSTASSSRNKTTVHPQTVDSSLLRTSYIPTDTALPGPSRFIGPHVITAESSRNTASDGPATPGVLGIGSFNLADAATPEATLKMANFQGVISTFSANKDVFATPQTARMHGSLNGTILNYDSPAEQSPYNGPKKSVTPGAVCPSHFSLNLCYPQVDPRPNDIFFEWLSGTESEELQSIWIMHDTPRTLKIFGHQLKDQLPANNTMSVDVFDVSIRRLIQIDSSISASDENCRWRHLLESDFAMEVMRDPNPTQNLSVREQFVGPNVQHELSRYTCLFSNGSWRCYVWDLESSVLFIMDPSANSWKDEVVISKHVSTIQKLCMSLVTTIKDLFTGWSPKFPPSKYKLVRIPGMPYSSRVSGAITLFCIWYFDGNNVTIPANKTTICSFRSYLLNQVLQISLNNAAPPSTFLQSSL